MKAVKTLKRAGKPLVEDPVVRAKLGKMYAELEVQRYAALRVLSVLQKGDSPGSFSSVTKLSYSEFEKRFCNSVCSALYFADAPVSRL